MSSVWRTLRGQSVVIIMVTVSKLTQGQPLSVISPSLECKPGSMPGLSVVCISPSLWVNVSCSQVNCYVENDEKVNQALHDVQPFCVRPFQVLIQPTVVSVAPPFSDQEQKNVKNLLRSNRGFRWLENYGSHGHTHKLTH